MLLTVKMFRNEISRNIEKRKAESKTIENITEKGCYKAEMTRMTLGQGMRKIFIDPYNEVPIYQNLNDKSYYSNHQQEKMENITKRFKSIDLRILKTVGKGTYGNVYLCERRCNSQLTIVKDIELQIKLQDHKQDIANEVQILSSLRHSNIIKFYDCYYTDNHVMISMEYATNGNLAEYMYQKCPKLLKQQEILFYFCQVLLGVNYIHSKNIIHRDLKAENILLTGKEGVVVKIGDFGISKMLASAKKTSTVIGTPYYLAPELCEGKPYCSKSDVWALGCLLYEMCTHRRAFDAETLVGLVKAITSGSVHPIDLTMYDRSMQDLVDSMLSIMPDKRPSVKELMGRMVLLPDIYTVYLDAGNDEFLYLKAKQFV